MSHQRDLLYRVFIGMFLGLFFVGATSADGTKDRAAENDEGAGSSLPTQ